MTLGDTQEKFTVMVAGLIMAATRKGYGLTFGDTYRDPRLHGEVGIKLGYGAARSCHKVRLAVDFNVRRGGKLLEGAEADKAHADLHSDWVALGGAAAVPGDLNHYSVEYGERR